jgi:hypothetical protein
MSMPEYLNQKDAFMKCRKEGRFIVIEELNIDKIKSMLNIAESDIQSANDIKKGLTKNSSQWNTVYKLYYDALHELTEAYLRFDKIKIDNHQCLFAYLCEKYPELDLSWEFFEKVRTKRNGINYYGTPVTYNDWKEAELQFTAYIRLMKDKLQKKIIVK